MKDSLRWAYALNQWNVRLDVFVRHEDQQRALKTVAACGFDTIELASGTGRWDNISRPEVILLNHGSHQGFLDFLRRAKVQGVSSMFWDPQAFTEEEEGYAFRTTANPADSDAIVEWSKPFVDFVAGVGAEQLVVRPVGSAWMSPPLDADGIKVIGDVWNRIGELTSAPDWGWHCTTTAWAPCTPPRSSPVCSTPPTPRPSASRWTPPSSRSAASTRWPSTGSTPTGSPTRTSRTPGTPTPARSTGCPGPSRRCSRAAPDGGSSAGSTSWAPRGGWSTGRASSRRSASGTPGAGSSSRAPTGATPPSWRCSTAGICSTSWG